MRLAFGILLSLHGAIHLIGHQFLEFLNLIQGATL